MSKKAIFCPACGSEKVKRFEKEIFARLTLGNKYSYKEIYYKCNHCKEEGDYFSETDNNFLTAQKNAQS